MNIRDVAQPKRWQVDNHSPCGGQVSIAGWDFGGQGPLAVLHHANGLCAAAWAPVAVRLIAQYRVIALDGRGHGDSEPVRGEDGDWTYYVNDLIQVVQQLLREHQQPHIALGVGSSMGGIVTAAAEARMPGLYKRIVMLDPPIHPDADSARALGYALSEYTADNRSNLVAQTKRRQALWPSRDVARQAWQNKPLFAAWHPDAFTLYLDEGMADTDDAQVVLKCDPSVEAHIFATTGSLSVLDYAPKVRAPVHFVHAANGIFDEEFFRKVVTLFPNAHFSQMQAGHMLPLEIPDEVCDFLLGLGGE